VTTFLASVPAQDLAAVRVDATLGPDGRYDCPLCEASGRLAVKADGRAYCFGCGASGLIRGRAVVTVTATADRRVRRSTMRLRDSAGQFSRTSFSSLRHAADRSEFVGAAALSRANSSNADPGSNGLRLRERVRPRAQNSAGGPGRAC